MRLVYNPLTKTWTDESGNSVKNTIDVGRIVLRQGTSTDFINEALDSGITKYEGEPSWNTTTKQLYVHDGTSKKAVQTLNLAITLEDSVVCHLGDIVYHY